MQSKMNGRKSLMTDSQTEESLMTNLSWTSDFGNGFEAGGDGKEPEHRQTDRHVLKMEPTKSVSHTVGILRTQDTHSFR